MSEAKAAALRIGNGAAKLLEQKPEEPLKGSTALSEADRFEEGQLSGPFGPKFVGYGEVPGQGFCERWGATLVIAGAIAAGAALIGAAW